MKCANKIKEICCTINKTKVNIKILPNVVPIYEELEKIGIIEHIKEVPQLGTIKIPTKTKYYKYEYIMLQLFLIGVVFEKKVREKLEYSTGNILKKYKGKEYSIGETLQILVLANGIGHFKSTFVGSKAMVKTLLSQSAIKKNVLGLLEDNEAVKISERIISESDYLHFHLINSFIILSKCENSNGIEYTKEIIKSYLTENNKLTFDMDRWNTMIQIFKIVRNITFNALDLIVAKLPYRIQVCDEQQMSKLLEEGLSKFNDNSTAYGLIKSLTKLLNDTLYNAPDNVIIQQNISNQMVRKFIQEKFDDYYEDVFLSNSSVFNSKWHRRHDFNKDNILKLTLPTDIGTSFFEEVNRVNFIRCGYYNRGKEKMTVIISISNNASNSEKTALKILKIAVKYIRKIHNIEANDYRFLLTTKFFIYHLLNAENVRIDGTLDDNRCVLCTMGKNQRISQLPKNLNNRDQNTVHEVECMKSILYKNISNEITITVPSSIKIRLNNSYHSEYDGLIIYPNRSRNQVIFLEAKNFEKGKHNKSAATCLKEKFNKAGIEYNENDIKTINKDAYMSYTV